MWENIFKSLEGMKKKTSPLLLLKHKENKEAPAFDPVVVDQAKAELTAFLNQGEAFKDIYTECYRILSSPSFPKESTIAFAHKLSLIQSNSVTDIANKKAVFIKFFNFVNGKISSGQVAPGEMDEAIIVKFDEALRNGLAGDLALGASKGPGGSNGS